MRNLNVNLNSDENIPLVLNGADDTADKTQEKI